MLGGLADVVAVVHGALVLSVVCGAVLAMAGALRHHQVWERAYYALLFLVIAANVLTGDCPLTRWEQGLRNASQPGSAYCNSFIGHYLPWLPPGVLAWIGPTLMAGALLAAPLWRWADRRGLRVSGSAGRRRADGR